MKRALKRGLYAYEKRPKKRLMYIWKETYKSDRLVRYQCMYEKRLKLGLYTSKKTPKKRPMCI